MIEARVVATTQIFVKRTWQEVKRPAIMREAMSS